MRFEDGDDVPLGFSDSVFLGVICAFNSLPTEDFGEEAVVWSPRDPFDPASKRSAEMSDSSRCGKRPATRSDRPPRPASGTRSDRDSSTRVVSVSSDSNSSSNGPAPMASPFMSRPIRIRRPFIRVILRPDRSRTITPSRVHANRQCRGCTRLWSSTTSQSPACPSRSTGSPLVTVPMVCSFRRLKIGCDTAPGAPWIFNSTRNENGPIPSRSPSCSHFQRIDSPFNVVPPPARSQTIPPLGCFTITV